MAFYIKWCFIFYHVLGSKLDAFIITCENSFFKILNFTDSVHFYLRTRKHLISSEISLLIIVTFMKKCKYKCQKS